MCENISCRLLENLQTRFDISGRFDWAWNLRFVDTSPLFVLCDSSTPNHFLCHVGVAVSKEWVVSVVEALPALKKVSVTACVNVSGRVVTNLAKKYPEIEFRKWS